MNVKIAVLIGFLSGSISQLTAQQTLQATMLNTIKITLELGPKIGIDNKQGMKVPFIVKVVNGAPGPISFFFNPNDPTEIVFSSTARDKVSVREQLVRPDVEEGRFSLKSGESYSASFDLTRFLEFKTTGNTEINYCVTLQYYREADGLSAATLRESRQSGSLKVTVPPALVTASATAVGPADEKK